MNHKTLAATGAALAAGLATAVLGVPTAAGQSGVSTAHPSRTSHVSRAATASPSVTVHMQTSNAALAACFPHARAHAKVELSTDRKGFDRVRFYASGLQPNTDYTLFLLEEPGLPFGAAEYFGDFTTDKRGRARNDFRLIVEEAFAFNNRTGAIEELNSLGFWFADETADDNCLGAKSPVTPFDGDKRAGVQMMNSGATLLP